jgi:predicted nucleic acid-binding protein
VFVKPSGLKKRSILATYCFQSDCQIIEPGARHWNIFTKLCSDSRITGNLVSDAWFAALAIESGCEWITTDGDYARFKGLNWRPPF